MAISVDPTFGNQNPGIGAGFDQMNAQLAQIRNYQNAQKANPTGGVGSSPGGLGGGAGMPSGPNFGMGFASGFGGPSNDPNAFTTNQYSHDLNQNSLASAQRMGQINSNVSTDQFNQAWNADQGSSNFGYGGQGSNNPNDWNSNMAKFEQGLGGVSQNEMANPYSNLHQVPNVNPGDPFQHFMQAVNQGTGVQKTFNGQSNMTDPNKPYGGTVLNYNGGQQFQGGQPQGAGGQPGGGAGAGGAGMGGNAPQGGAGGAGQPGGNGQVPGFGQPPGAGPVNGFPGNPQQPQQLANSFSGGTNPLSGPMGHPMAGGFNNWGMPSFGMGYGNPFSYMTGQTSNGLGGGQQFRNGWVPNSGAFGGGMGGFNPMAGQGNMGGFAGLQNSMMGINPFMFGGYQSPTFNIGEPNTSWQ